MSKEVVKKTEYNKVNTKVNNLENKNTDMCTLIWTNQYNADKQNLEKQIGEVEKKIPDISSLVTTTVFKAKLGQAGNKIPEASGLWTTTFVNRKIGEAESKMTHQYVQ